MGSVRDLENMWAGKKKGDFMGIYEKMGLLCLAIVIGFVYFKADARKPSAPAATVTPSAAGRTTTTTTTPSAAGKKVTTGVSPAKKGVGALRAAPKLTQTGRSQYLKENVQMTVGEILEKLQIGNKNRNFMVAVDTNKNLIQGDPTGSIANSASVTMMNVKTKKLVSAKAPPGNTLNSIIQSNLQTVVTLKSAPAGMIQKLLQYGKLDALSKDPYSQILLYFTLDSAAEYNNIWFFIIDPWPFSIVIYKAYPAYDIIEGF